MIRKDLEIPLEYQPLFVIAVGYEEGNKDKPLEEKKRLPFGENFFLGKWNYPL